MTTAVVVGGGRLCCGQLTPALQRAGLEGAVQRTARGHALVKAGWGR